MYKIIGILILILLSSCSIYGNIPSIDQINRRTPAGENRLKIASLSRDLFIKYSSDSEYALIITEE